MAVMTVWAAVLITYGVSTGMAMDSGASGPNNVLPLNMAPDSVDDMYSGCKNKMRLKVLKEYLPNEKNKDKKFKDAWNEAEKQVAKHKELQKEQAMAIYVYSMKEPNVYCEFNCAVRTQTSEYMTTFRYHALHFFLTDALQTLNPDKKCLTGYRGVNRSFSKNVLNKEIRFGSFTSSSKNGYIKEYGDKSCFEIYTCYGADISKYTKEPEGEVLIPPYEVFKVEEIKQKSDDKTLDCEVVYKLKSTKKPLSKLNCALSPK